MTNDIVNYDSSMRNDILPIHGEKHLYVEVDQVEYQPINYV